MNKNQVVPVLKNLLSRVGHDPKSVECLGSDKECWCGPKAKNGMAAVQPTLSFGGEDWIVHSACHKCAIVEYIKILETATPAEAVGSKGASKLGFIREGTKDPESLTNLQIYLKK